MLEPGDCDELRACIRVCFLHASRWRCSGRERGPAPQCKESLLSKEEPKG